MLDFLANPRFRAILAQTIAVTVKNLLLLDFGVSGAFPIILVPALTGLGTEVNRNETLRITAAEASWLGSTLYIFFMFSSFVSGVIIEPMGRKRAMLWVNIPHLLGWLSLYVATSHAHVFIGMALLGTAGGLAESPIITYVGEICEASLRDVMVATSGITTSIGFLLVFGLGSWYDWRTVALIATSLPIAAAILIFFIPETPIWLLSRHRDEEAAKSLQWLRGWVSESDISDELNDLKRYREYANSCAACRAVSTKCSHPLPSLADKMKEVVRSPCMKPMIIITLCSLFTSFTGAHHLNPYLVQILKTYETPLHSNYFTMAFGVMSLTGTIAYLFIVKFMSKRSLYLISISLAAILNLWLGIHGFFYLSPNTKSFEYASTLHTDESASYIPFILVIVLRGVTAALLITPTLYASELFSLKARCIAAGIATATTCVCLSMATKTFYNFEYWLDMSTTFCVYGVIGFIGLYVSYKTLPLTEGLTLEEIEKHYADGRKKITDWKILHEATSK